MAGPTIAELRSRLLAACDPSRAAGGSARTRAGITMGQLAIKHEREPADGDPLRWLDQLQQTLSGLKSSHNPWSSDRGHSAGLAEVRRQVERMSEEIRQAVSVQEAADPPLARRHPALSWKLAAEALVAAYPDRQGVYLRRLAPHVWAARSGDLYEEACRFCGLAAAAGPMVSAVADHGPLRWWGPAETLPNERWLRMSLCGTCLQAAIALVEEPLLDDEEVLDGERIRADVVRAVREFAPAEEKDEAAARVERWLSQPLPVQPPPPTDQVDARGEPRYQNRCDICRGSTDSPLLAVTRPPSAESPGSGSTDILCQNCLLKAQNAMERKPAGRRAGKRRSAGKQ